jgi:hypothetical protein
VLQDFHSPGTAGQMENASGTRTAPDRKPSGAIAKKAAVPAARGSQL